MSDEWAKTMKDMMKEARDQTKQQAVRKHIDEGLATQRGRDLVQELGLEAAEECLEKEFERAFERVARIARKAIDEMLEA